MVEFSESVQAQGKGYIGFQNIVTNIGGAFSSPSFLVPVNGTYFLQFQVLSMPESKGANIQIALMKNGVVLVPATTTVSPFGNTTMFTMNGMFLGHLKQRDIVQVHITDYTGQNYVIGGDFRTYFLGFKTN